jgi:signal peptidase II
LKRLAQDYLYLFLIAGAIIIFDQYTKTVVRTNLNIGETWAPWPWLMPYARIVNWKNYGAAFGMLPILKNLFTGLAIVVSLAIIYYFPQVERKDWWLRLAMELQLGGAVGNLIDRLRQGYVTDFVSLGNFPVFNVADASISTGVAVLVIGMWWKGREEQRIAMNSAQEEAGEARIPEEIASE